MTDNVDSALRDEKPADDPIGVSCPTCGCEHLPVYYTRKRRGGKIIRVRICRHCGRRVLTTERVA